MKKIKYIRYFPRMKWKKENEYILPDFYDVDRMVLLTKEPYLLYAYWDISVQTQEKAGDNLKHLVLRVNDVTDIIFNGHNAIHYWDTPIHSFTDNWYIHVHNTNRNYLAELGFYQDGAFVSLLRSNSASTPLDRMMPMFDQQLYWLNCLERNIQYGLPEEYNILEEMIRQKVIKLGENDERIAYGSNGNLG